MADDNLKDTGAKISAPRTEVKDVQVSGMQTLLGLNLGARKGAGVGELRLSTFDLSQGGSASQFHISTDGTDTGAWILVFKTAGGDYAYYMSPGARFNGSNWIAKDDKAAILIVRGDTGVLEFYYNTGLTVGNSFIPALKFSSATATTAFGDGSDGDLSTTGNVTLTKDMNYNNLTVNAGHTLFTNGFMVRVKATLTVASTGIIDCSGGNGGNSSGGTGGAAGTAGFTGNLANLCAPTAGTAGATPTGNAGFNAGPGGQGGGASVTNAGLELNLLAGSGGGGGGGVSDAFDNSQVAANAAAIAFRLSTTAGVGGVGGSAVAAGGGRLYGGGGGGGGGGPLVIFANTINNAGTIQAKGGNGGNGQSSGDGTLSGNGGGGGGGLVIVNYRNTTGSGVGTLSAAGGTAGTGGNGGAAGGAGTTASFQI